jgi:NAD(P)-dependent dehydrogenase (short-subunit alcohol dehydrogenase family)
MAVAIVTGASRGLGRALAEALAEEGWSLVLDARGAAALGEAADRVRRRLVPGAALRGLAGDVADPAHRVAVVEAATQLGGIDLLVNNASTLGTSPLPHLDTYPLASLRAVLDVNVLGVLGLVQAALPALRRAVAPAVVNVTSDASVEAYEGWGGYGLSKAALDHMSAVLAVEEPGVAVWAVDPGDMRTAMHQDAFPGEDISDRPLPEDVVPGLVRLLHERPPSGRYRLADLTAGLGATS